MQIVKFEVEGNLPAYLANGNTSLAINDEVVTAAAFPSLSIKGKQFTISKDGARTVITKPDDPEEVAQSIGVVFLRANMNAKTFYAKKFSEGDSEFARPDCYSLDGVAPSANSQNPQSKKCTICPHNQWGSRVGDGDQPGEEKKGKACSDNARIAVSAPDKLDPMLLRVPPASLKPLRDMLKVIKTRKIPYNAVVVKMGFDREAASPKLTFKPVGLMDDAGYQSVNALYDDETVRAIVGLDDQGHHEAAPTTVPGVETDELDAALAAREVTKKAASTAQAPAPKAKPAPVDDDELDDILAKPKAEPEPKAKPKAEPAVKAKPAPKEYDNGGGDNEEAPPKASASSSKLLSDLDDLLGGKDD